MESDWEVEIGGRAPVIDAGWEGWVDLRNAPQRAYELPETRAFPPLGDALIRLNAPSSGVWTSKCDVWRPEAFDPDELDAPAGAGKYAQACYIDLLPAVHEQWPDPGQAVLLCRQICAALRVSHLHCCRADLIVRRALGTPSPQNVGITAYITACGPSHDDACATLASALAVLVEAVLNLDADPKLQ